MLESAVLETSIGVVFLFLLVALIAMATQELLSSLTKLRARTLRSGLATLLDAKGTGAELYQALIVHPRIVSGDKLPSYISAQQFSAAVVDILGGASSTSLKSATLNVPPGSLRTALQSLFREGDTDMHKFEAQLQSWFDESMDRLSGIYKRYMQVMSLILCAVIAFFLHLNVFGVAAMLWSEPVLRSSVAQTATAVGKQEPSGQSLHALLSAMTTFEVGPTAVNPHDALAWLGCLVTALAASLGAPFWFDLLQRVANIRSTGPVPAKADTKGSSS